MDPIFSIPFRDLQPLPPAVLPARQLFVLLSVSGPADATAPP